MTDRDSPNLQLAIPAPNALRKRCDRLLWQQQQDVRRLEEERAKLVQIEEYLALAPAIEEALDKLSEEMFGSLTRVIEQQLSIALQEVLDQPDLTLKVERQFKNRAATMKFYIERNGQREDIMRGQGGSVANVLSVGLRLFALTTLDEKKHRRFLVLDEQDCWLRPDLVPALAKMVRDAGRALGFQVIMISHHDLSIFERYADRVYRFTPSADGVKVECAVAPPSISDAG
jgi:ABC-type glutathione transport system ATPase component